MFYVACFLSFMCFSVFLASNILLYFQPKKYKKIKNRHMFSGASLARNVLDSLNLKYIEVELSEKKNISYFDFKNNVVKLKSLNFNGNSIYDIAVSLKLVEQVVLYKEKHFWSRLRFFLTLKIRFCSYLFLVSVIFFGPILQKPKIAFLGVILLVLSAFFELIIFFGEFITKQKSIELISLKNILEMEDVLLVEEFLKINFVSRLINIFACFFMGLIFVILFFSVLYHA